MKGMKGRILKKLKSIPQVSYLKQSPLLHFNGPPPHLQEEEEEEEDEEEEPTKKEQPMREFNEQRGALDENKENINPTPSSFRRPDPNSATLFDPNLLAAFQQSVIDYIRNLEQANSTIPRKSDIEKEDPLLGFEEKIPPHGGKSIILYTTSLGGIRKTFEDCNRVRFLLENLKLVFVERDLAMHIGFREELWALLGFRAIPPRLFIKGRYIGGVDEVLGLHERGKLLPLVKRMARSPRGGIFCEGCGGIRFNVCSECNGGRKVYIEEEGANVKCARCNENGLIVCSLCC